jgi:glycosyltransferase involved in cell wall biosynthesis
LLHIVRSLNPATGGPVEAVRQLVLAQAEAGGRADVLTLDPPGAPWLAGWPGEAEALGGIGGYGFTPALDHALRASSAASGGIFVHGLWQWQGAGTWRALRESAARYFVFSHGMLDPWFARRFPFRHLRKSIYWKAIEHRVIRDAAAVIFTCEEERRLAQGTFTPWEPQSEAVIEFGSGRPPAPADELRERFFSRFPELRGQRLLLFLGRLHEKKGCDLLLQAFRNVAPPLHLVLAGPCDDTRLEAHLRRLAHGLPVTFTGPLYELDKWAALATAEAFILPSHQENFGLAVTEALASGVPALISNAVNIWREIDADGAGLVEPDTLAGTEKLLRRWLEADGAAMKAAAKRCFATRFDIRQTAAKLAALAVESSR